MNKSSLFTQWNKLIAALEESVDEVPDSELLNEPLAVERVKAMRLRVNDSLAVSRSHTRRLHAQLPRGVKAKRELLRRALALKPPQSLSAISFSSPESLSDAEVESALEEMLQAGLLPTKESEKK